MTEQLIRGGPPKRDPREASFVSVSIDLSGSTAAKRAIQDAVGADIDALDREHATLFRQFADKEHRFYGFLLGRGIDLDRIFCVKAIGDEVWVIVETPAGGTGKHRNTEALAVIDACLEFCDHTIMAPVTGASLPLKFAVDLIDFSTEVADIRVEELKKGSAFLRQQMGRDHTKQPTLDEVHEIMNRLSGCAFAIENKLVHRTDYVGFEADRFFRMTKCALRNCVTIGQALADHLQIDSAGDAWPITDGAMARVLLRAPATARAAAQTETLLAVRNDVPETDPRMKGVGSDYTIYRLLLERHRNSLRHQREEGTLDDAGLKAVTDALDDSA